MLTNIIDEKTHNFAHSAPQTVTRRGAPERPEARGGLSVKT